jgi:hypothetical protein
MELFGHSVVLLKYKRGSNKQGGLKLIASQGSWEGIMVQDVGKPKPK